MDGPFPSSAYPSTLRPPLPSPTPTAPSSRPPASPSSPSPTHTAGRSGVGSEEEMVSMSRRQGPCRKNLRLASLPFCFSFFPDHININNLCHYILVNVPGRVFGKLSLLSLIVGIEKKKGQFARHAGTFTKNIVCKKFCRCFSTRSHMNF